MCLDNLAGIEVCKMKYDKYYDEAYAYLAIKVAFFPDLEMQHGDNPDWVDAKHDIGLEVTRAELQPAGNTRSFWNKYRGKKISDIPKCELEKRIELICLNKNDELKGISIGRSSLEDSDTYIYTAVKSVEEKLGKLNKHYRECTGGYWLAAFLTSDHIDDDRDHLDLFISQAKKLLECEEHKRKFDKIFLLPYSPTIHSIDLRDNSYCRIYLVEHMQSLKESAHKMAVSLRTKVKGICLSAGG